MGDVVGRPGRRALTELLPGLREEMELGFVVANAENAAGGSGLTAETAREILAAGADCLTTGDHFYEHKGVKEITDDESETRVLRPANWSRHAPGRGWGVYGSKAGPCVGVLNLMGRVFMRYAGDNPFDAADAAIEEMLRRTPIVVVDVHAEATSEKIALGRWLDGRASFVFGTHTHVQTADERILPGGTAYVTDVGMTGPDDSILGRDVGSVLARLRTGVPARFGVADGDVVVCGALATVDSDTGRAVSVERVRLTPPRRADAASRERD